MKKRILFVDDEPNVLQGLQRMLRSMHQEWEMQFASSGEEALDRLGKEPFDVVVSDMRMPGMNGAELLASVMKRHPQVVRIILSGYIDEEMVLKSVRPAHQYLAKPCDSETLKSCVLRACTLRDQLADDSIRSLVSRMDTLPSLPTLYSAIIEELGSKEASMQKIGTIISKDIGMTAKILQLVNSAFFGLRRHVTNPAQAVSLLGLDTVRALVLSVHIFSQYDPARVSSLSLDRLWKHSFATGFIAKAIVKEGKQSQMLIDDAFMAGLLHDLGKPILSMNFPEPYTRVLDLAKEKGIPLWRAEGEILGTTHSEVGAYLMGLWGLPDHLVEGIAFHHVPGKCAGNGFSLLLAVHVSNALEHQESQTGAEESVDGIDHAYLSALGVTHQIPSWKEICHQVSQGGEVNE